MLALKSRYSKQVYRENICYSLKSRDICLGMFEWTGPLAHLSLFSVMFWLRFMYFNLEFWLYQGVYCKVFLTVNLFYIEINTHHQTKLLYHHLEQVSSVCTCCKRTIYYLVMIICLVRYLICKNELKIPKRKSFDCITKICKSEDILKF